MEPRVVLADNAGFFTLSGTRSFIVGLERVAIVDPGPDDPDHLEGVARQVEGAREGMILLTHRHPDHAAGARGLAALTGFPVRPVPGHELSEGERIETDAGGLEVVPTPGHSRDHLAFFLRPGDLLLAGDLVLGEGDTTWVGEYPGCVGDYLASLDRVEALAPRAILPAHGPRIEDPATVIARYREHRLARIRAVEKLLDSGVGGADPGSAEAVDRIVEQIYGDALPAGLREGARWSVRAVLDFLGAAPFPPQGAPTESGGTVSHEA